MFHEIAGENSKREIRCGDFNAHNNLWGSSYTDKLKECYSEFERSKNMEGDIDEYTDTITASMYIPISKISGKRKIVPWWNDECSKNEIELLKKKES